MFFARSLSGVGAGELNSWLGSSSSTCSLEGDLGEASKIFGSWIEKYIGGSRVTIERICDLSGKISKTKEVDKEVWK